MSDELDAGNNSAELLLREIRRSFRALQWIIWDFSRTQRMMTNPLRAPSSDAAVIEASDIDSRRNGHPAEDEEGKFNRNVGICILSKRKRDFWSLRWCVRRFETFEAIEQAWKSMIGWNVNMNMSCMKFSLMLNGMYAVIWAWHVAMWACYHTGPYIQFVRLVCVALRWWSHRWFGWLHQIWKKMAPIKRSHSEESLLERLKWWNFGQNASIYVVVNLRNQEKDEKTLKTPVIKSRLVAGFGQAVVCYKCMMTGAVPEAAAVNHPVRCCQ